MPLRHCNDFSSLDLHFHLLLCLILIPNLTIVWFNVHSFNSNYNNLLSINKIRWKHKRRSIFVYFTPTFYLSLRNGNKTGPQPLAPYEMVLLNFLMPNFWCSNSLFKCSFLLVFCRLNVKFLFSDLYSVTLLKLFR
jgi:hypothetical protein